MATSVSSPTIPPLTPQSGISRDFPSAADTGALFHISQPGMGIAKAKRYYVCGFKDTYYIYSPVFQLHPTKKKGHTDNSLPWVPEVCTVRFPVSVNVSIVTRAKNLWSRAPFL